MFKNPSVKTRLQLGFTVVSGLFLSILLISGVGISRLAQDVQTINEKTMPNTLLADGMNLSRSDVQQFLTDVSTTHDAEGFDAAEEAAQRFLKGVEKFRQAYQQGGNAGTIKDIEVIESSFNEMYAIGKVMAKAYADEGMEAGNVLMKGTDTTPGFDQVEDIISGCAAASQEQSSGIEQVNQAIAQMDQVTQQNAALVEEAAAAAESLQDQAAKLTETVSVFRLEGASHGVQPVSPARQGTPARAMASPMKLAAAGGGGEEWEEFRVLIARGIRSEIRMEKASTSPVPNQEWVRIDATSRNIRHKEKS